MADPHDKNRASDTPRMFHVCADHKDAEWNQPQLEDADCVLCRLFYLEAQESLLEEWQQRAKRAEDALKEVERPLDAQMARLNDTIVRLNEENERLRSQPSATLPPETRLANAPYGPGQRIVGIVIDADKFRYMHEAVDWLRSMLRTEPK